MIKTKRVLNNIKDRTKWCPYCQQWLPFKNFSKSKSTKSKLAELCRSCRKQKYYSNPSAYRNAWYKYHYGISANEVNKLLENQGGKCAICGTTNPGGRNNKFHLDHNHSTKEIRGLLCDKCNRGLGFFNDSTDLLHHAINYLQKDCCDLPVP